ncbi:MAG TPA: metallophosphoesterase family protein [Dongiaceae bacterium]|nr:metallophosphoesterase family protein [Dongiaceae bacterium]
MRIAVVSDIHGNLTALEAVIADLRHTGADVVLQGGDLAHGGAGPAEVVDRVRELGWAGVRGNTDEMLWAPETLQDFAAGAPPGLKKLFEMTEEMRMWTCERLGEARVEWLKTMPMVQRCGELAVVHASPDDTWRGPGPESSEAGLQKAFGVLEARVVVYGHIHMPFVRELSGWTVANSGSVSLSYDGDARASYAVVEGERVEIRRVEYDIEAEVEAMRREGLPHGEWVAACLRTGKFVGV